ncbi:MAG: DUF362 domain-containing protein [Candidatus Omnitrophica bacterium]|nr:DUF362 domain-containing protein [Candidatus Omnitrophota bacterium]
MKTKVTLARCSNYSPEQVDTAINKAMDLLGGIESIIRPKSKVLIKPNLLTDSQPQDCITTHPRIIESIIRLVKKTNSEIYVGDSPGVIGQKKDIDRVYETTGMKEICQRQGVEMAYFDKAILKNGIPITEWTERCDYIINVPKFKTHGLTKLTAAIKNSFGFVLGMHKAKLHKDCLNIEEFSRQLVDIFELAKPTLTIVDAVISLEGDGPGSAGVKTDTELILASQDAVAIDSILATIMGIFPEDVPTTKEAKRRDIGESDLNNIDIIGENLGEFIYSNFKFPKISFIYNMPKPLLKLAKKLAWHKMKVIKERCQSCRKCIEICPVGAIRFEKDKACINPKKCILCSCCQEICPNAAITVQKSLLLKILGV